MMKLPRLGLKAYLAIAYVLLVLLPFCVASVLIFFNVQGRYLRNSERQARQLADVAAAGLIHSIDLMLASASEFSMNSEFVYLSRSALFEERLRTRMEGFRARFPFVSGIAFVSSESGRTLAVPPDVMLVALAPRSEASWSLNLQDGVVRLSRPVFDDISRHVGMLSLSVSVRALEELVLASQSFVREVRIGVGPREATSSSKSPITVDVISPDIPQVEPATRFTLSTRISLDSPGAGLLADFKWTLISLVAILVLGALGGVALVSLVSTRILRLVRFVDALQLGSPPPPRPRLAIEELVRIEAHVVAQWEAAQRTAELERLAVLAELETLRSQMNPHFLFNALNSVANAIENEPEAAVEMVVLLSDLYRCVLRSAGRACWSLREELGVVDRYLQFQKTRFGERLRHRIAGEDVEAEVPPMLLQTVVENAVKHGVEKRREPTTIAVSVDDGGNGFVRVTVENEGQISSTHGERAGLRNASRRLQLLFPEAPELTLVESGTGTVRCQFLLRRRGT